MIGIIIIEGNHRVLYKGGEIMGRSMGSLWFPTIKDCLDIAAEDKRLQELATPEDTLEPGEPCTHLYVVLPTDCQLSPLREELEDYEVEEDQPLDPPWQEEAAQDLADFFEEKYGQLRHEVLLDTHLIHCFSPKELPANILAICTSRSAILCHTPPGANTNTEQLLTGFCLHAPEVPCRPIVCEEGWLH